MRKSKQNRGKEAQHIRGASQQNVPPAMKRDERYQKERKEIGNDEPALEGVQTSPHLSQASPTQPVFAGVPQF